MSSDTFTRVKNTARNAFTTVGVLVVGGGVAAYLFNRRTRAVSSALDRLLEAAGGLSAKTGMITIGGCAEVPRGS